MDLPDVRDLRAGLERPRAAAAAAAAPPPLKDFALEALETVVLRESATVMVLALASSRPMEGTPEARAALAANEAYEASLATVARYRAEMYPSRGVGSPAVTVRDKEVSAVPPPRANARVQERREADGDTQLARNRPPKREGRAVARTNETVRGVEHRERRALREHRPRPPPDDLREVAAGAGAPIDDRLRRHAQFAQLRHGDADGKVTPVDRKAEHADAVARRCGDLAPFDRKSPPLGRADVVALQRGELGAVEPKLREIVDVNDVPRPIDAQI
jgi:hypothetical protein